MDDLDINGILFKLLMFYPMFLFSLTIHEIAHALTANWGGDMTATYEDRLSLNPLVHMDPLGTFLIPIINSIHATPLFGWAKPVPVNEARFADVRWNVVVALAGPFSNLLLALFATLVFSLMVRCQVVAAGWGLQGLDTATLGHVYSAFFLFITLNLGLMAFNLVPIPPLDGSHVFYHFVVRGRGHLYGYWDVYQQYGSLVLMLLFWALGIGFYLGFFVNELLSLMFAILAVPGGF